MPAYKQISEPSTEPLTYQEVKEYLRLNGDTEQAYVTSLIVAARQVVESRIWRPLISQQWQMQFDFHELNLLSKNINKAPLLSIESVTYYDGNNDIQTLSPTSYEFDLFSSPPRVRIKTTPTLYDRFNALQINFTCGYLNAASVPKNIKIALFLIVGHLYENRQDVVTGTQVNVMPQASEYLLEPYRNNFIFSPLNG
jgi:uncharacterized phiE125 gp8 family phage protein